MLLNERTTRVITICYEPGRDGSVISVATVYIRECGSVAPGAQLAKGRLPDAGGPRFESQAGRVTGESAQKLWRDKHPAIKGLQPPEHLAGRFHADQKTCPSQTTTHFFGDPLLGGPLKNTSNIVMNIDKPMINHIYGCLCIHEYCSGTPYYGPLFGLRVPFFGATRRRVVIPVVITVVIPVVIPLFHLVGMTALRRVAVWFAHPTGVCETNTPLLRAVALQSRGRNCCPAIDLAL